MTPPTQQSEDKEYRSFDPPSAEALDALLPAYHVSEAIAQGGMGAIYKGIQTKLDRPVAIKVLPKHDGTEHDYASRFELEAKAMARLKHNNIVGVYDYGETSDGAFLYLVMEYVDGADLHHFIQKGEVPVKKAISILAQICSALEYAHQNQVVHLDIKPANILIEDAGTVKIADFGLARIRTAGAAEDPDDATAFGTPEYVAPESLQEGAEVDHRADIYSLGIVAYEILTGQPPRGAFKVPTVQRPGIDRRFNDIVLTSIKADPDERFSSVAEIHRILNELRGFPGSTSVPASHPTRKPTHKPSRKATHKPARPPAAKNPASPAAAAASAAPVPPAAEPPAATTSPPPEPAPAPAPAPAPVVHIPPPPVVHQPATPPLPVRSQPRRRSSVKPSKPVESSNKSMITAIVLTILALALAFYWFGIRTEPVEKPKPKPKAEDILKGLNLD